MFFSGFARPVSGKFFAFPTIYEQIWWLRDQLEAEPRRILKASRRKGEALPLTGRPSRFLTAFNFQEPLVRR